MTWGANNTHRSIEPHSTDANVMLRRLNCEVSLADILLLPIISYLDLASVWTMVSLAPAFEYVKCLALVVWTGSHCHLSQLERSRCCSRRTQSLVAHQAIFATFRLASGHQTSQWVIPSEGFDSYWSSMVHGQPLGFSFIKDTGYQLRIKIVPALSDNYMHLFWSF
jgi:hypothetical protein